MTTKLFELRIKAGEMLGLIESLGPQYEKECMDILQALMNAVFAHMSSGAIQAVNIAPCNTKELDVEPDGRQSMKSEVDPDGTQSKVIVDVVGKTSTEAAVANSAGDSQSDGDDNISNKTCEDPEYVPGGYSTLYQGAKKSKRGRPLSNRVAKRRKLSSPQPVLSAASESESEDLEEESFEVPENDSDNNFEDIPDDVGEEIPCEAALFEGAERSFDCEICEGKETFSSELDLMNHVQDRHMQGGTSDNDEFTSISCHLCDKIFKHRKNLKTSWVALLWHRHAKHGIKLPWYVNILSCPHCRRFKCCTNNALAQHMKVVHNAKTKKGRVMCTYCNVLLKPSVLKTHMKGCKTRSTGDKDGYKGTGFWCGLCKTDENLDPFKGDTLNELVQHVKDEHVNWKSGKKSLRKASLRCDKCPKSLICRSTVKELYYHIMWHRSERHSCQLPRYIKVLTCSLCGTYSCVTKKDLKDHMRHVHSNVTRINCDICGVSIKPCSLKVHMKSCHTPKTKKKAKSESDGHIYSCEFCSRSETNFVADDYEDLVSHVKSHHMKFKTNRVNCRAACLTCDICEKALVCRSTLKNLYESILWHRSEKHGVALPTYVRVLRCAQCNNYACISAKDMRTHERQVHNMERMPCPLCGTMIKPSSMKTHMECRHPTERKAVNCEHCGKEYTGESNLRKHIERMHTGSKSFLCEVCCKQFYERDEMYKHMFHKHKLNPLSKKTHKCDECEYEALSLKDIQSHKTVHSDKRNFCCELCGKEFKRRGSLSTHRIIMHSDGITRYSCDECGFTTHVKQYLIRHKVIHSQEKRHVCQVCGYATHFQENLRKHEKNKHGQTFGKRQRAKSASLQTYEPPPPGTHHRLENVGTVNVTVPVQINRSLSEPDAVAHQTFSPHTPHDMPSDIYRPQGDFRSMQNSSVGVQVLNMSTSESPVTSLANMPYFQYTVPAMTPVFPTPVITSNSSHLPHIPHSQADISAGGHEMTMATQPGHQYAEYLTNPYTLVYPEDHNVNKH